MFLVLQQIRKCLKMISSEKDWTEEKYHNILTKGITSNFIKNLLIEVKKFKTNSVLDIGCGTGYITKRISLVKPKVIGCDIDKEKLVLAKKYTKNKIRFKHVNDKKLPFKDNSFDLIICSEVLEHIEDIDFFLTEIKRVGKKFLLITVPNEPYFRIANFLRLKNVLEFGNGHGHINHFNKKTLKKVFPKEFKLKKLKINSCLWLMAIYEL